jgi:hypothetical protein
MTVADGVLPSIWHLPPLEQGGPIARQGFDFQDHVGVNLCIAMLCDEHMMSICFETHDDLVVHWNDGMVEFIQVKSDSPNSLLSVAWLCKKGTKSVLARSLAREACKENCCFRIVTKQGISQELEPLKTPREKRTESSIQSAIAALGVRIAGKLKSTKSPKGSGVESWVERTLWEVQYSEDALIAKSCGSLDNALEELGYPLLVADRNGVYEELLKLARSTSIIIYQGDLTEKVRTKQQIIDLVVTAAQNAKNGQRGTIGLREKLNAAGLMTEGDYAANCRRTYLRKWWKADYIRRAPFDDLAQAVRHRLHDLFSSLQSRALTLDGPSFYKMCVDAVDEVASALPTKTEPDLKILARGCMFEITNRCQHRFVRIG